MKLVMEDLRDFVNGVKFVSPNIKMWFDRNILFCKFSDNLMLSLEIAKSCNERRIYFSKGSSYPLLIDMTGIKSSSKGATEYLATVGTTLVTAGALVVKSEFDRLLGNLLISFEKPEVPTRLFTNEEKAKGWLSKYT